MGSGHPESGSALPPVPAPSGAGAVAVLMSGGVDSSVAALLLQRTGWTVVGVTMQVLPSAATDPAAGDPAASAASVCRVLGIPHHVLAIADAFQATVIDPFRAAYQGGRTPNPCVLCNPAIKFGLVWDRIRAQTGIEFLATGHYARILGGPERSRLARARHTQGDQSYFLYRLPNERLARLILPLGTVASKDETRALARAAALPVAEREDSMEVCFIPGDDYRAFLGNAPAPGPIRDLDGNTVGEHPGIQNFTVGQRRWLGRAFGEPMYVLRILPEENTLVIGTRAQAEQHTVRTRAPHVLQPDRLAPGMRLRGKIRSGGEPRDCQVTAATADSLEVLFDAPVFAPTPGQHLVLYDAEDCVVGGGEIA